MQAGLYFILPAASCLEGKFLAYSSIRFKLTKPLHSEAQRALGFNDFFKKINPEVQDWYTNTVCVSIVLLFRLSLNGDVYISTQNIFPNSATRYLLEVSLALMFIA